MNRFTDEQMIEIGEVRERLEVIRNKVQPYPAYPEELKYPIKEVQPTNKEILDKLHREEVLKNDLENRLNKHIDASKKYGGSPF